MATFGGIVQKSEILDTSRPMYSEPLNKAEYQPTAADLEVQAAVEKLDNTYLAWVDAWNGKAPEPVTTDLWNAYQRQWQLTQDTIARCWHIPQAP